MEKHYLEHQHRINWTASRFALALLVEKMRLKGGSEQLEIDYAAYELERIAHLG